MNVQVLEENKNKRGELKRKVIRVTNKISKKGLKFDTINKLYENLLEKYKANQITIIGKCLTGTYVTLKEVVKPKKKNSHVTIKSQNHQGSLKYADDKYFSSQPKAIKEKSCL